MKKKKWETPELIVVVRSKPEEAVLETCKSDIISGPKGMGAGNCHSEGAPSGYCEIVSWS